MGKRKYISEQLFVRLSGVTVFVIWLAIAVLGFTMSYTIWTLALVPDRGTSSYFDLSFYPWMMWAGLLGTLLTALWVACGLFGGVTVYFNLVSNNHVNNIRLEELIR